ncbi:MAG TPA: AraC family transcriptional regulator [Longimicrobiales bacterium]|nr:AraC family transcriptional regulator [Longimicrobiales bacterium]
MIIGYISDPCVRAALLGAGHSEEDVVLDPRLAGEALAFGYPRLVVCTQADGGCAAIPRADRMPPSLVLPSSLLARWEEERRSQPQSVARTEWTTGRIRELVGREAWEASWVDRALSDLGRAAGMPLPPALRGFGRRVLEFPSHYDDLHPLAEACRLSRGALKARFRRRGLPSPYAYLRWFRAMAVAYALSDRAVTVAQVANRLGYTSDGNLCRAMLSLTRLTPTEARTLHGWNRLLISFAWTHLGPAPLEAWRAMDDLFVARVA